MFENLEAVENNDSSRLGFCEEAKKACLKIPA